MHAFEVDEDRLIGGLAVVILVGLCCSREVICDDWKDKQV